MANPVSTVARNLQAIAIYEKIGFRKGLTMAYMGAGNNNKFLGKKKEGAVYFFKAMNNAYSLGDSAFYYQTMAEYASLKYNMGEKDSAVYYFDKSIPYLERNNFRYNLITAYITYSDILIHEKPVNDELVRKYTFGSLTISKELDVKDNLQYIYGQIGLYYVYKNKPDSVYYYMALSKAMADSLCVTQNMEILHETQTKFETEKKDLQIKNQSLELSAQEKENEAKTRMLLIGTLGLIAVGVFAVIAYRNFRKTKRANVIINEQKERVEEQKGEIEKQKVMLEVKQKEITDSITYAKDIQSAFMPNEDIFHIIHPDAFVYSKPKDIVSGDFYWFYTEAKDGKPGALRHCAVADCTGHGVPGALMSGRARSRSVRGRRAPRSPRAAGFAAGVGARGIKGHVNDTLLRLGVSGSFEAEGPRARGLGVLRPGDQAEATGLVLDDRRAVLHPVAGVNVKDSVRLPQIRLVNVTADDAGDVLPLRLGDERGLEVADELDRALDALLDRAGEAPVGLAQPPAHRVHEAVKRDQVLICPAAQHGQPPMIAHDGVELVAVNDEEAPAVGRGVIVVRTHLDVAEARAEEVAEKVVVITGNEDNLGPLAGTLQELVYDVVVLPRPVPLLAQRPDIDDVSDQVEVVAAKPVEELVKALGLGIPGAQMHIGNEDAAVGLAVGRVDIAAGRRA